MKKFVFLFISLVASVAVSAQVTTSSIGGRILDEKGAPLAGATVKAVHTPTGTAYYTSALTNGRFNIGGMRVGGPYELEISFVGYTTEKTNNISLTLGEEAIFNYTLKESAQQLGEIVVTGSNNPVFSSNRTGAQEVITSDMMAKLPSTNRSLTDYTKLAPMSNTTNNGNYYGGVSYRFNNVTVDGASFNNSFGLTGSLGASGIEPISIESIEQIQVMLSPDDVRSGGFTGGGVNSVTKSGSNEWSASLYGYMKSPQLEGIRQKDEKVERPEYNNKQYGVTVSGPIIKNKLFFFVNGELERQDTPINYRAKKAGEEAAGNISNVDYDKLADLKQFLSDEFSYNPGSFELSNVPVKGDRLTARLDWNINSKNSLNVKYFYLNSFNTVPPSSSGVYVANTTRSAGDKTIPFASAYYRDNKTFNIVMADLNTTINDRMYNTLKVGYSRIRDFRECEGGQFPQVDILDGDPGSTSVTANVTTFGMEANSYNNQVNTDIYQIQDNFTMNLGNHQVTLGTQSDYRTFLNGYSQNYPGAWFFASVDDFKYNALAMKDHIAGGGNFYNFKIADYPVANYPGIDPAATGKPLRFRQAYAVGDGFPFAKVEVAMLGFYLQDKWAVMPNLHLTAGIRMDMPIFLTDLPRNEPLEAIAFANGEKVDVSKYPSARIQWSPRVGFNWDVFDNRRLQIRGGAGLFSGTPPYVWISNQAGNNGLLFVSKVESDFTNAGYTPGFTGKIDDGKPTGATLPKADIAITDPDLKYPTLLKTSLAADWDVWDGWILSGEFLYSKNINDIYHNNIALEQVKRDNGQLVYVRDGNGPSQRPMFKTINNPLAYTVVKLSNTSKGYSAYTTFKLQKSFNYGALKGLFVNASYTFGAAKGVTDGSSSVATSAWKYRPALNPNADEIGYSLGSFDNRWLVTASYRKEYAKHFATSIGIVYDRYMPFRYSYCYYGDINGDGQNANDLVYIPRAKDEINLAYAAGATAEEKQQAWDDLNAFIEQDPYLSKHRGEYAERNGAKAPIVNRIDLNFTQDFYVNCRSGKRHTIRLTADIRNFGNLLNKDWGVQQTTVLGNQQYQFLEMVAAPTAANNYTPSFKFATKNKAGDKLTETYKDYINIASRWSMMIGVKYFF